MVRLSRYTHCFDLGDSVALYHSLRMKPVYLKKDAYEGLRIIKVLEGLPNLLRGFREGFTIKTSIVVEGSS